MKFPMKVRKEKGKERNILQEINIETKMDESIVPNLFEVVYISLSFQNS